MEKFYKGKGCNVTINDFSSFVDFNGDGVINDEDEEWLYVTPKDSLTSENYWNTEENINKAIDGMYVAARTVVNNHTVLDGMRLNNQHLYEINANSSLVKDAWVACYTCCRYGIMIQTAIEKGNFNFDTKPYLAQANALRAFVMCNMAIQWGNIPILTKVSTDGVVNEGLAPSAPEEQLKYALGLVNNLEFGKWHGNVYVSQAAVDVLKAEIYLTLGLKNEACSALKSVSDEDVFLLSNKMGKKDIEVYSKEYIEYLKEEANGTDNSAKWFVNRTDHYGTFAALKRFCKVQSLTGVDSHYNLLPIPQNELYLNPKLTQNHGY